MLNLGAIVAAMLATFAGFEPEGGSRKLFWDGSYPESKVSVMSQCGPLNCYISELQ